ncbi:FtsQ-type POTRA domain-containing protein, partial [Alphaproteobacteria bacterium]|nr:FtsQ-type POTRA domain-containing protein [Alphaproteobacteria bacterium]
KHSKTVFKPLNNFLINKGFILEKVEIFGIKNLPRDNILKIVHAQNTSNIFNINLLKLHNELSLNTWVNSLHIERVLPNTIKIDIKEKQPIAILQNEKGNSLITKQGKIISNSNINKFKNDLPIICGDGSNKNAYSILKIMEKNKDFSKHIWSLNYINKRRWNLHFNQGLIILLPAKKIIDAWEKIVTLQKHYNILNLGLTEIDVRNPNLILGKVSFDKNLILNRKS